MNIRRSIFSFLVVGLSLLALPALAGAATESAHSGQVTATVSYTGPQYMPKDLTLTIVRAGKTVVDHQPITDRACSSYCSVSAVRAVDLDGSGEPTVILDVFTGGAHCCSIAQIYRYNATSGAYAKATQNFGNSGYSLEKINGNYVFITNDDRFYYAFTSFAESGAPIQIFALSGSRFYDVTRAYPGRVRSDAAYYWKTYLSAVKTKGIDTTGLFADWAADEELLGHGALVTRSLAQELRKRHLRSGFLTPKQYAKQLPAFLHQTGYTS